MSRHLRRLEARTVADIARIALAARLTGIPRGEVFSLPAILQRKMQSAII